MGFDLTKRSSRLTYVYILIYIFCCKTGVVFSLDNPHIITRINNYIILTVIILQLILVLSTSQYV